MDSRKDLSSAMSKVNPKSHVNYRYLTNDELQTRLKLLHQSNQQMTRQLLNMRKKLEEAILQKSVALNDNMSRDLVSIMELHNTAIKSENTTNSFRHVFWDQQLKAAARDPKGMRWHPLMIR